MKDTIFANCSGVNKTAIYVFRISGHLSLPILKELSNCDTFDPRHMYCKKLYTKNGDMIDEAMVVYFNGPLSFTGEETVEIYTHGSIAVGKLLSEAVLSIEGVRPAEAGEFAKRAFLNNKLSLTEAEGLADLIDAETSMQQKQAISQMNGELEQLYQNWRTKLLGIMALIEAYIDFPEEDIPSYIYKSTKKNVAEVIALIQHHLNDNRRGERLKQGISLAIFGPPNAGKSSLINYLMQKEIAIVSPIAGTTRDVIEAHLDIGGYPIILKDTAGIRGESVDVIENEGIRRAMAAALESDIKILMLEASSMSVINDDIKGLIDDNTIIIANKIDLYNPSNLTLLDNEIIPISLLQETNVNAILDKIINLASKLAAPSNGPAITRLRYRVSLEKAIEHLTRFHLNKELVLAAEDIRMAIRCLCFIFGKIDVDEILGEIFSKFCIGK